MPPSRSVYSPYSPCLKCRTRSFVYYLGWNGHPRGFFRVMFLDKRMIFGKSPGSFYELATSYREVGWLEVCLLGAPQLHHFTCCRNGPCGIFSSTNNKVPGGMRHTAAWRMGCKSYSECPLHHGKGTSKRYPRDRGRSADHRRLWMWIPFISYSKLSPISRVPERRQCVRRKECLERGHIPDYSGLMLYLGKLTCIAVGT